MARLSLPQPGPSRPSLASAIPPATGATISSAVSKGKEKEILPPAPSEDNMELCDNSEILVQQMIEDPEICPPARINQGVVPTANDQPPPLPFPAPPAPIGLSVHADAVAARSSRTSNVTAQSATVALANKSHLEPRITQVMNWMKDRCAFCLLHISDTAALGHTTSSTTSGCPYTEWDLATLPDGGGMTWGEAKSILKAPGSVGICFICLWPLALHEGKRYGQNCQKDQVGPICWMLYVNSTWRRSLFDVMRPDTPINTGPEYLNWMCRIAHRVKKPVRKDQYVILNAHLAVIWAMKSLRGFPAYDS
ncbi:hypothetical protein FRC07_009093 [Ceratobasidium sp. 392]|nr:hypothetical protein FRC07_009093 [Ceratobasidium sp. 392]